MSVWNRDADFNEWMAMGGAQASFWSIDRDYTQASLDSLRKGRWGKYKSKPWQLFSALGEYSELGTRVGYYKKAKKALAEKNGGKIDRGILIQAALESRDLTDFARGGKTSRDWNSAVAFANASIQGWDKFARTFDPRQYWSKDPEIRKQWERAMIRLALGSILPTVLLFMLNHDEDWYEEDLPDWERQTHWIVGENLRIPKGQDVGLRFFSNLTESMLRSTANNDPKAFQDWWKPAWEAVPDFIPTALQPIIECMTNYDMFRKNAIVPARQQKLPEYMQYDSRTSALAKGIGDSSLAKLIAGETGISPAKIDHFIYGYTGKLGQDFIRLGQNALGVVFDEDWVNYDGFTDLPIISGIKSGFLRVPYRNPRILNEYYETLDEQTKLHNEFKMTKKRPEGYNHSLYTKLHKAQEQMQELTKKERKILDDTKLDGDERDNRQLAIQKKRVALAEKVLR